MYVTWLKKILRRNQLNTHQEGQAFQVLPGSRATGITYQGELYGLPEVSERNVSNPHLNNIILICVRVPPDIAGRGT